MTPTLGLAVIAKNEESTLPNLLASIDGAFDQMALLDTGSSDRTVEVFEQWASTQRTTDCRLGHFEWCDDFAAARNAADDLLDTDWLCWADADDEIVGAERLRPGVRELSPSGARGIVFDYLNLRGDVGPPRLRVRDRSLGIRWEGRLHEGLDQDEVPSSAMRIVGHADGIYWLHRTPTKAGRGERNLRIIKRWIAEEPNDPRPHAMLAHKALEQDDRTGAVASLARYLDLRGQTLPDPGDAHQALRELESADHEADLSALMTRILGRESAAVGTRTRGEKEAGLSRQQRRALARRREKEQRRVKRIAERSGEETVAVVHAA